MDQWNGLKIAEEFYNEYGKPMLEEKFPDYLNMIAAGLAGQGSECFGYDDAVSRDHDYAPGFCIWIPEFVNKKIGDELQQAYDALPVNEFSPLTNFLKSIKKRSAWSRVPA